MNNWIEVTPERPQVRLLRRAWPATSLSMLLILGGLLIWPSMRAHGQPTFAFNPVSPITNGVGNPLSFTLSVAPVPPDGVTFGHGGLAPANSFPTNATLDSVSGLF